VVEVTRRGHRCPGEPLAASILTVTFQRLAGLEYTLSEPSRTVPLGRTPSLPPDRLTLTEIGSSGTGARAEA
jgi:hypothetical protein